MIGRATVAAAALAAGAAGCLDPLVTDEVPEPDLVLPPGTAVPRAEDDPRIERQIANNDGVSGMVPLLSGFAEGEPIKYWDFGDVPDVAVPVYVMLRREDDGTLTRVAHNTIVDAIPGDDGYSPYWAVVQLVVTDAWQGEIIPSVAAISQAEQLGLIEPPAPQPFAVNCPAVADDITLEVGGGNPPLSPPSTFYWRGRTLRYYDFGVMPMGDTGRVSATDAYVLRREGGEPLSEPERNVDMTGDGDVADSNNLFEARASDDTSPLCRTIEVVVPSSYQSIDSFGDDSMAEFRAATDVFDPGPVPGNVIAYETRSGRWNCVLQREAGGL